MRPKLIGVTGARKNLGKTQIVLNLGFAISLLGKTVIMVDADPSEARLSKLVQKSPRVRPGLWAIELDREQDPPDIQTKFLFAELVILDLGEATDPWTMKFCPNLDRLVMVLTPEPASITETYTLMKILFIRYGLYRFHLIVNRGVKEEEAFKAFETIDFVAKKFMSAEIEHLGHLPEDKALALASMRKLILIENHDESPFARGVKQIARYLVEELKEKRKICKEEV